MKMIKIIMILFILTPVRAQQVRIKMSQIGGIYTVPCKVNDLALNFVFDTAASDVSISLSEAVFMLRNGYLDRNDIGDRGKGILADGSIVEHTEIVLRKIEIGGKILRDVKASVIHNMVATLLLGQSALKQLGGYSIDGDYLIIGTGTGMNTNSANTANPDNNNYSERTYYYDANWKGVNSASQATYIRKAYTSKVKGVLSYYKDYYKSGKLRGEGGFISIDSKDDSNTIFNGEIKTYYENGMLRGKSRFVNGKREGERFLYFSDQSDTYRIMTYKNDERTFEDFEVDTKTGNRKRINIP